MIYSFEVEIDRKMGILIYCIVILSYKFSDAY